MTIVFVTAHAQIEGGFLVIDVETGEEYGRVSFARDADALVKCSIQDMRASVVVHEHFPPRLDRLMSAVDYS